MLPARRISPNGESDILTHYFVTDILPGVHEGNRSDMLTFNAIDVETANVDRASICQIGIVHVRNGAIKDQWQTLVNPEDWFDPWNVSIHGIDEDDVKGSPTLPEVRGELGSRLRGSVLVSHTAFDRVACERAMMRYSLEQLQVTWLDSARIARRAWPDRFGRSGYGLKSIAMDLNVSFKHHDAQEVYRPRVFGQWFDGIRFYAAASSPTRSRRTWAGLR